MPPKCRGRCFCATLWDGNGELGLRQRSVSLHMGTSSRQKSEPPHALAACEVPVREDGGPRRP